MTQHTPLHRLRAVCAALACAASVLGAPAMAQETPGPGPDGPVYGAPGFGPPGPPDDGLRGAPPFLRGLDLTEAQQDRVFAILHAQAPKRRELEKAERRADAALHELARAPAFDQGKAAASAQALGQAIADQELLRLQTGAELKAVLTPEQRAQLEGPRGERRAPRKKGARKGERKNERQGATANEAGK